MYSHNSITKAVRNLREKYSFYLAEITRGGIGSVKMCISTGNRKIGRVLNVSLPPVLTCANCSECKYLCYDIKACLQYANVVDARARNLAILRADRDEYFRRIDDKLSRRRTNKFFR